MLSISPPLRGSGKGNYYLDLAREDYYLEGGEPPGKWQGRGAKELGLSGAVEREQLSSLLEGYNPKTKAELVRNAGAENRQSAWDLTFSAPKSVSVLWSQADPEMRRHIQEAHGEAVGKALDYLDQNAAFTRRGEGGSERESGKLVFATFEHGTSRAQDPQLHTHALVLNVCTREDRTTGTIESRELYQHKMTAGALYRAELSAQLEKRLGVETERKNSWFEVKGVSEDLIKEFSKRREEIEAKLGELGAGSQRAADIATLDTRAVKEHRPREALFQEWQEIGKQRGWSTEQAKDLATGQAPKRDGALERRGAVEKSLGRLTQHQSYFSEREFIRAFAEEGQGRGISGTEVLSLSKEELSRNSEIVRLGEKDRETRYTTREIIQIETSMLDSVERSKSHGRGGASETAEKVLSERDYLSDEQKNAVRHITKGEGRIICVSGMAGTGKSTMLDAARETLEREGCEVTGCALSGKAAQGLEEGAKIESETLHKTLSEIRSGKKQLSQNSVLVVDEAGMVGTRQMAELVELTERSGSTLVLVGDSKQLQPIDAGGPFKAIAERVGEARLEEIRRQNEEWSRAAVKDLAFGDAAKALERYAERGFVTVKDTREEATASLIGKWRDTGGALEPEKNLILAGNNSEVRQLNALAQQERFNAGQLGEESLRAEKETLYKGDRVLFTRNSRLYGVRNGQLGTIEEIDKERRRFSATLDNGEQVSIPFEKYSHIQLGYAVTTHKSQGMTVENAFILAGGSMQDRELSYVQASRARGETRFFIDQAEAGEGLKNLSRQMTKSNQKELATSVQRENKQEHVQSLERTV